MTILAELEALDLSAVVDARVTITTTADGPQLQGVLSGDVGATVLGDIGQALAAIRAASDDPETLLQDVLAALPALGDLPDLGGLDLPGWEAAVREGAELVADLVAALGGDFSKLGALVVGAGGDDTHGALAAIDDFARVGVDELARLRRLVDAVASGVPLEADAFARMALDVLFPGPSADVLQIRVVLGGILDGASAITLPQGRIAGLLDAHAALADAAGSGDGAAIKGALDSLERAGADAVASLESDFRFVLERLSGLQLPQALEAISSVSATLGAARTGVLEFLGELRAELQGARAGIEAVDPSVAHAAIIAFLDGVEARAEELLVAPVQERVDAVEAWVRDLFSHLPLRSLRAELSDLVLHAAAAIEDADLDAPANALREKLDGLEQQVAGLDLGQVVRTALEEIEHVITAALDAIVTALNAIGPAVNAVADAAKAVVEEAVEVLRSLSEAVATAKAAIDDLPIEAARQEVVDAIHELRAKAEELLSGVSLPEGVRPLVDQLAAQLEGFDLETELLKPVDEALLEFHAFADVQGILEPVQQKLSMLVPAQIAAEIEKDLGAVLSGIEKFKPEGIKALVEGFLDETADLVEHVDLSPVREIVHQPFELLLSAFDELKPSALLHPVLDAYDSLVRAASLPDPVTTSQQLIGAAADAAKSLTPPLADAAQRVVPGAEKTAPSVPAATPPGAPRAGDIVRLFGWLPARLREALAAAGADARNSAVAALHGLVGGLAADLRRLQSETWAIGDRLEAELDTLLVPLANAQARAQLALSARLTAPGIELDVDLDASLEIVAAAGPAGLRSRLDGLTSLVADRVGALAAAVAANGGAIDGAAAALERSPVGVLASDVDAFLAALDPEPLAAELDALVDAAVAKLPALFNELEADLEAIVDRAQTILLDLNPATMLQRFLTVLDAVRDELDVLNPHTLARELDVIHDAARATLEAYDPAVLVDEVGDLLRALGTAIRNIDLSGVPGEGDLPELAAAVQRVEDALPTKALADVGLALSDAGAALQSFDLIALVEDVTALPDRVAAAMHEVVKVVKQELQALIGALKYQQTSASASVSVSGSVG